MFIYITLLMQILYHFFVSLTQCLSRQYNEDRKKINEVMKRTNQPPSLRLSGLRISVKSAQIIREIEWNRPTFIVGPRYRNIFVSAVLFRHFYFFLFFVQILIWI